MSTMNECEHVYISVLEADIDVDSALRVMGYNYITYIDQNVFSAVGTYL